MADILETVTVTRPVDPRIADLVRFARSLGNTVIGDLTDQELIARAKEFWDAQHGEDD